MLDAQELALIAQSERVKAPFINRENRLLEILNAAREAYTAEQMVIFNDYSVRSAYAHIERFEVGLKEFGTCWYLLPKNTWGEIDELLENNIDAEGNLVPDPDFDSKDRRYMTEIDDVIKSLQTAVSRYLTHRRPENAPGRKEETRELKAFVSALRRGWKDNCDEAFGATFGNSADNNGTSIPTGVASKLVVGAAKKLDPRWTVSQCQTAMDDANTDEA